MTRNVQLCIVYMAMVKRLSIGEEICVGYIQESKTPLDTFAASKSYTYSKKRELNDRTNHANSNPQKAKKFYITLALPARCPTEGSKRLPIHLSIQHSARSVQFAAADSSFVYRSFGAQFVKIRTDLGKAPDQTLNQLTVSVADL